VNLVTGGVKKITNTVGITSEAGIAGDGSAAGGDNKSDDEDEIQHAAKPKKVGWLAAK
jgi:hypothetical protein